MNHLYTQHFEAYNHKDTLLIDLNHTIYSTTGQPIPTKPIPPYFATNGQFALQKLPEIPALKTSPEKPALKESPEPVKIESHPDAVIVEEELVKC